jgi:hypothetical protein
MDKVVPPVVEDRSTVWRNAARRSFDTRLKTGSPSASILLGNPDSEEVHFTCQE